MLGLAGLTVVVVVGILAGGCEWLETPTGIPVPPTETPAPVGELVNGDFEGGWEWGRVHVDDGVWHDNIQTPAGWVTWWRQGYGEGGEYGQPEVEITHASDPRYGYDADLPRIRTGAQAVKWFTMYRPHEAGLYQVVEGLPPGAEVQVLAWVQAWTCNVDEPLGYTCEHEWNQITLQVGVEESGLADPFSDTIVWGPEDPGAIAPDEFRLVTVRAMVGDDGAVCVYVRSRAKWGLKHLDAYVDGVELIVWAYDVSALGG